MELDPDGQSLVLHAGVGWKESLISHARAGRGNASLAGFTLLAAEPLVVEDLRTESRFEREAWSARARDLSGMSVEILRPRLPLRLPRGFQHQPPDLHAGRLPLPPGGRPRVGRRDPAQAGRGGTRGDPRRAGGPAGGHDPAPRPGHTALQQPRTRGGLAGSPRGGDESPGHRRGRARAPRPRPQREAMFTAASVGFTAEQLATVEETIPDDDSDVP